MSKLNTSCGVPKLNKSSDLKTQPKPKGYFQKVFEDLRKDNKFMENFEETMLISSMFLFAAISGLICDFCVERDAPFVADMFIGSMAMIAILVFTVAVIAPVIDVLFRMLKRVVKAFKNAANE